MTLKTFNSILEIDPKEWIKLEPENFPFASYHFLSSLETSNSVGRRTGWFPLIMCIYSRNKLIGATYLYLKNNSYGEYIFDWAWADAWKRNGLQYYPKLVGAVPFTPATGPKILCAGDKDRAKITELICKEIKKMVDSRQISTAHFLFNDESELELFEKNGFDIRKTFQFHWRNREYESFDAFLMDLKQKKRKEIRRERKLLANENLEITEVTGKDVEQFAELFYQLYLSTIDKKWSSDYLTPKFFKEIFTCMQENIILFLAKKESEIIAGTLNFRKGNKLFGRYWGCFEDIPNLHFELCYYRPIEYAIFHKLILFEAGAQGEHKIQRGFIPSYTYSSHLLPDHGLGQAVKDFIQREAEQVDRLIQDGPSMAFKDDFFN